MLSRENADRLLSALQQETNAHAEVQKLKQTILGQQRELANAESHHATASAELAALFDEIVSEQPASPEPATELPLKPGKKAI